MDHRGTKQRRIMGKVQGSRYANLKKEVGGDMLKGHELG